MTRDQKTSQLYVYKNEIYTFTIYTQQCIVHWRLNYRSQLKNDY